MATVNIVNTLHVGHGSYVNNVASGGLDFTFAFSLFLLQVLMDED